MKKALALTKIYINSMYGFGSAISDFKRDKKKGLKNLALFILILFAVASSLTTIFLLNYELYKMLKPINQEMFVVAMSIISSTLFTLVFGMVTVIATYFPDKEENLILSMPIKGWNLLFAKFSSVYITEALISLLVMSSGCIIYGVNTKAGFLFYVSYILIALILPIIPMSISYFILIPIMKFASFLKKKDTIMVFSGFIGVGFALAYQLASQWVFKNIQDPEKILNIITKPDGLVNIIGKVYYPVSLGTGAIVETLTMKGIGGFFGLLLLSAAIFIILLKTMSKIYINSIVGGSEVRRKVRKLGESEFKAQFRGKGRIGAMLLREIKLMNREPIYFLNGPFVIILLPVILGVTFAMQGKEALKDFDVFLKMPSYMGIVITAGLGAFLGSSSNITATCLSREGTGFNVIKSMPIDPKEYIFAKFLHGFVFSIVGGVLGVAAGIYFFKLSILKGIYALIIALLFEVPIHMLAILVEFKWPKLIWDNPQKAIKQNMNAVIIILAAMFGIPGLIILIFRFIKNVYLIYGIVTIVPILLILILYKLVVGYAVKRFYDIEI